MENNEQIVSIVCENDPAHQIFIVTTSETQEVNRRGEVLKDLNTEETYTCRICGSPATYTVL